MSRQAATARLRADQLSLPLGRRPTWGGARKGAGRKPKGPRPGVPHSPRPPLRSGHPVHVTLRAVAGLPSLRSPRAFGAVRDALDAAARPRCRLARAVNRAHTRRGRVWGDRYHARALTTPREVRHALLYVLMNWKKHRRDAMGIDPCSSGMGFDGWRGRRTAPAGVPGMMPPRTWLLRVGWRRHGLLDVDEHPAPPRRPRSR